VASRRLKALIALCKLRQDAAAAQLLGVSAQNAAATACAEAIVLARDPSAGDYQDFRSAVRAYVHTRTAAAFAAGL
jgi:hypothetical protein